MVSLLLSNSPKTKQYEAPQTTSAGSKNALTTNLIKIFLVLCFWLLQLLPSLPPWRPRRRRWPPPQGRTPGPSGRRAGSGRRKGRRPPGRSWRRMKRRRRRRTRRGEGGGLRRNAGVYQTCNTNHSNAVHFGPKNTQKWWKLVFWDFPVLSLSSFNDKKKVEKRQIQKCTEIQWTPCTRVCSTTCVLLNYCFLYAISCVVNTELYILLEMKLQKLIGNVIKII